MVGAEGVAAKPRRITQQADPDLQARGGGVTGEHEAVTTVVARPADDAQTARRGKGLPQRLERSDARPFHERRTGDRELFDD